MKQLCKLDVSKLVFLDETGAKTNMTRRYGWGRSHERLAAHKVHGVRAAIESVGAKIQYLPPYSPDLNPIELSFSKLKALLRSAAARTISDLESIISSLLDRFRPSECENYFRHCGYTLR